MDESQLAFLDSTRSAAMVTTRRDGTPHVVRIAFASVDGKLWSSSRQDRLRTRYLRRDPRCTLFVFRDGSPGFLTLDTTVTILEGPDVPDLTIRLFQVMQPNAKPGTLTWYGQELTHDQFRQAMIDEGRVLYEFDVHRAYGIT